MHAGDGGFMRGMWSLCGVLMKEWIPAFAGMAKSVFFRDHLHQLLPR
jgi:hypothetical protein